jgi:large subunit ribosomal protein L2
MGKNLIQQRRGKGSVFQAPSHTFKGSISHKVIDNKNHTGEIVDFIHCRAHTAPLAKIVYEDGETSLVSAFDGSKIGDIVKTGSGNPITSGNTLELKDIPEGTLIYNIESCPGDGGKFVRAAGTCAILVSKTGSKIVIELPSKKTRIFQPKCRATVGIIANSGRFEKPVLKAGKKYFMTKARNKRWPIMSGSAMSAVAHPFGNKRSSRKAKNKTVSRNAPPGRKVGKFASKRTGRKK